MFGIERDGGEERRGKDRQDEDNSSIFFFFGWERCIVLTWLAALKRVYIKLKEILV